MEFCKPRAYSSMSSALSFGFIASFILFLKHTSFLQSLIYKTCHFDFLYNHFKYMTKFENIEFRSISRTQKYGRNLLQTILDKRLCLSSMFQNPYRFNIYIFMFTNEIRPYKSHAYHRDKVLRCAPYHAYGCPRC